jgi:hypothetical protein
MLKGDKKYIIKYEIILDGASPLKDKEIKINNCCNGVHAQVRLEEYLKKKYINFKQLVVVECKEDPLAMFSNLFGSPSSDFGDLLKGFGL